MFSVQLNRDGQAPTHLLVERKTPSINVDL